MVCCASFAACTLSTFLSFSLLYARGFILCSPLQTPPFRTIDRSVFSFDRFALPSRYSFFFLSFFFHTPVSAAFLNKIFLNFDFFTRLFFFFRIFFFTLISFLCKIILDVSIFRFNFDFSFSFLLLSFSSFLLHLLKRERGVFRREVAIECI